MIWRLIWQMLASLVLSAVLGYVLLAALRDLSWRFYPNTRWIRIGYNAAEAMFGASALPIIFGFLLFMAFMVLFQLRQMIYLGRLRADLGRIAEGNFDETLPVRGQSELSELAEQTNRLVEKLKLSLDEERRMEQTKNELITNVSHDLRTPLTSILGYLGLIDQDRYRDEVELRHYVAIAYEKAQRLHLLTSDLFELTRTRSGAAALKMTRLNLVELLGQLLVHHRLTLADAGMKGDLRAPEPELPVSGDPIKLARVFENLLANAVQYGREGKRVDFAAYREDGEAVVEVVNYGEPIPTTDLPYIFDRFYRVDKSRTEHAGGSGLGLAIVKGLVEQHKGRIEAFSDAERTVFQVRLPVLKEAK
ncbi:GHKL domain-containing protein [Cohnella sp. CBP 2801]|uniref:histidine kinase n=2 Tax=Cohnella zeiphila TaxID=2761120 RepID=A0A7X0SIH7_9BACL|nr:GHKL domain-containing protein [Cohnella zeiphila]